MWVNDVSVPADALDEAATGLAEVVAEFADELGGPPTLAEFLELVGWAIPGNSDAVDGTFPHPLRFKVVLKGNKQYRDDTESRVSDLDDVLFEDARDHHRVLVEHLRAAGETPVTPQQFASALLQVLHTGRIILSDVEPEDIRKLTAEVPKTRAVKPKPGDVLAIPAEGGGYHMAVLITRNSFGTALGLFTGTSAQGRLDAGLRRAARKYPVYTGSELVVDGTWKIVDHDDGLLELFPSDPPIYHAPDSDPDEDNGEFGAAETAEGAIRLIGPDEAREIGLQDRTYQQFILAPYLQKQLDVDAGRS